MKRRNSLLARKDDHRRSGKSIFSEFLGLLVRHSIGCKIGLLHFVDDQCSIAVKMNTAFIELLILKINS